ncbi:hypothetical protein PFISCL1PPCAC_12436, partial [Pristionchus fissidentatus]
LLCADLQYKVNLGWLHTRDAPHACGTPIISKRIFRKFISRRFNRLIMSEYASWSEEFSDAAWSSAPAPPPGPPPRYGGSGGGGGGGYPGADAYDAYSAAAAAARSGAPYGGAGGGYDSHGSAGYGRAGGAPQYPQGGGGGAGYDSGFVAKSTGAVKASDISYDTSSRDPAHLRSRVFIGSLGRGPIVREDIIELCRPFGPLMAVTLFKGYAFVQYERAEDADNACEVLNAKRWKGVNIDVHLAMEGLVRKTLPQKRPADSPAGRGGGMGGGGGAGRSGGSGAGGGGRGGSMGGSGSNAASSNVNDWPGAGAAKRARGPSGAPSMMSEEAYVDINDQNKKAAQADSSAPEMIGTEMADTLICGTCRYVTSDFVAYREHRKKQCVKPKDTVEPPVLRCASCGLRFLSAWKMLFHLTDFHRMQLFKPDYTEEALERAKMEDEKYKNVSSTRMEAWKAEVEKEQTNAFELTEASVVNGENGAPAAAEETAASQPTDAAAEKSQSFTGDDDIVTFGGADAAAPAPSAPIERVTTGADYDEDEEDD